MIRRFLWLVLILINSILDAQDLEILWTNTYGSGMGFSVIENGSEGYVVTGPTWDGQGIYLLKTDISGNQVWKKTYGDSDESGVEIGMSVIESSDNSYVIAGATTINGASIVALMKTDLNGDTLWTRSYGPGWGISVAETSDSCYILLYDSQEGASLIKTDLNGDTLWTRSYGTAGAMFSGSVIESNNGDYVLTGGFGEEPYSTGIIKVDDNGDTLWTKRYDIGKGGSSIIESTDGGYVIVGDIEWNSYSSWLIKTDVNGDMIWTETYEDSNSFGGSVIESNNGGFVIGGGVGSDLWVSKTDIFGSLEWTYTFEGVERALALSVKQSSDGAYVVTGASDQEILLFKIQSEGPILSIIEALDGQIYLSWQAFFNIPDLYRIYRREGQGEFMLIDSVGGTPPDTFYWDNNVQNGTLYGYKITAVLGGGESSFSHELAATPNAAPTFEEISNQVILEDEPLVITSLVTDPDEDLLEISATSNPNTMTPSLNGNELTLTPMQDWFGEVNIEVIAQDYSLADTIIFSVSITSVNDKPLALAKSLSVQEDSVTIISLEGTSGPENESDQTLEYIIVALPTTGYLTVPGDGVPLIESDLPLTLSNNQVLFSQDERFETTTFEFQVQDDGGVENNGVNLSDVATVSLALNIPYQFSLTTAGPIEGGVTMIDSNILYVASSGDGVHRYDVNGNAIYTLNVDGDIKSSTTITTNHIVYIASTDNSLYSFNANGISNTGWPVSLGAEATASVAVDASGTAYIGTSNGIFQAVTATGEVSWGYNVGGAVYASAAISQNNTLYIVNENGRVFAFDLNSIVPSNVQYSWVYEIDEGVYSSPALDDFGNLHITTSDGNLIKIEDTGTAGQEVWRYAIGTEITSSPVIGSDYTIYFGSNDSTIYAVNSDGSLKWASAQTGGEIRSTAALVESGTSHDRLYIGSDDGYLYAVSLIDGSITWKYNAQSPIQCPILFSEATVYFGTMAGEVIAIQDDEVVPLLAKMAEVSTIWPTFQGNNARTGMLGGGTSIPAVSNVHPGDTDNDGDVDAQDILPIGVYFLEIGHSRSSAGVGWTSQEVTSWESYPANYADCNGDGVVDEKDVIAIGVNWGETHEDGLLKYRIDPTKHDLLNQHKESFEKLYSSLGSNMGAPGVAMKRVLEEILQLLPSECVLYQNYPNPFNPDTEIQFSLPKTTQVSLRVFNIRGETVSELINGNTLNGGYHSATFKGSEHSSGVYFYDLSTPDYHAVKKMLLVK